MFVRTYTLNEILSRLLRRRWLILIPFALGAAAAPILAGYAPELYRSDALILVIPQRVPESYVRSTISESVEDRLPAITDQILSRSRLELIIQEMDLYEHEQSEQVMEDIVQRMRGDVTTSAGARNLDSFRVSYVSDTAQTAQRVTERLASLYIEQNLRDRESQAENTSLFLSTQLEAAKQRLIEQEQSLEDYRKAHAGELPSQLSGNLQAIQNAHLQLQSLNEATNRALERQLLLDHQLADAQALAPALLPPGMAEGSAPSSAAQQLASARARRTALLQRYTPSHPDVVSLERTIAELVIQLEGETPVGATQAEMPMTVAEAAQRKRILDLQANLAVIERQLASNRVDEVRLKQTIAEYQARVDIVPTRESELVELTRDYSTLQLGYANLLTKREDAVIAANLERRQIGEQFRLLDVASLPERPYNQPWRLAVTGSGSVAGLVLGLLLVGLLEYRDSSFRCEEDVMKTLSVPVLALIPVMSSDRERRGVKWRRVAIDVGGTAVLVAAGAVVVLWRLQS